MRYPDAAILVMARAPVAGQAKTRLIPALGDAGAAALHINMIKQTVKTVTSCYREAVEAIFEEQYTQEKIDLWIERLRTVYNRDLSLYNNPTCLPYRYLYEFAMKRLTAAAALKKARWRPSALSSA